uniref:Uncharacterized protein n=1 Tax=Tanacetum cinerariifolium TaxID=118510 RepID=A0A6L2MNG8_TANCI|nr:hypothetical protein [Tanacetum cinerariifolium]
MLVIKRFRERKKIFRERKLSEKFMQRGCGCGCGSESGGDKRKNWVRIRGRTNVIQMVILSSTVSEEDEEDPEEDHVDYPANGGDTDDNESSDDDNDDDDDEDGEDDEEVEHLASVDPSVVPINDHVPSN